MYCDTAGLQKFYTDCATYVHSHLGYFEQVADEIRQSRLFKIMLDPTEPDPALADCNFGAWGTDRWRTLMNARAKMSKAEATQASTTWGVACSELLAPLRVVWNMIIIMYMTPEGIRDIVYTKVVNSRVLEGMLYVSLRTYVSMSPDPRFIEWATKHVDIAFFCLDVEKIRPALANSMFSTCGFSSMITTIAHPILDQKTWEKIGDRMSASFHQRGDGINGWFQMMHPTAHRRLWHAYIRSDAIRSSLLAHPESVCLRHLLCRWAHGKAVEGSSMSKEAMLVLSTAINKRPVGTFVASDEEKDIDNMAAAAVARMSELLLVEDGYESWRDLLARLFSRFFEQEETSSPVKRNRTA